MSLATLFAANNTTGPEMALALSAAFGFLDPLLFVRVDQGRQPLPKIVVDAIANRLGVNPVDVVREVTKTIVDVRAISRTPLPPLLGDEFQATRLGFTPGVVEEPVVILWDADEQAVVGGEITLASFMTLTCPTANRSSRDGVALVNIGLGANAARAYSADGVTRGLLLEPAAVNNVTVQDLSEYSVVNAPTISTFTTPAGTIENCQVEDDDAINTEFINGTIATPSDSTTFTLSAWQWVVALSGSTSLILHDPNSGPNNPRIQSGSLDTGWTYRDATGATGTGITSALLGIFPGSTTDTNTGIMRAWGMMLEESDYPTSFMGSDNVTFARGADVLRVPPAAMAPGGFYDITTRFRTHFVENETDNDVDVIFFDPNNFVRLRTSDKRMVMSVNSEIIEIDPLTFSRHQELIVRAQHTLTGRRLTVSGATGGNGTVSGIAKPSMLLSLDAYLLGNASGASEGVDLRFISAT